MLRLLIAEDRPDDAELIMVELESAGLKPEWQRVDTEQEYVTALDPPPDIIISDHAMPRFSSQRALELLKARGLDIPFIVVSGTIGESTAVEMMRAGAHDYLLKDNLSRLAPAVRRELRNADVRRQQRQVRDALIRNEARYRSLVMAASQIVWTAGPEGRFVETQDSWRQYTGLSAEALADAQWCDALHPEDRERSERQWREALAQPEPFEVECRLRRRDGEYRTFAVRAVPVRDGDGDGGVREWIGACADISERVAAQREMRRLSSVVEQTADAIVVTDREGVIEYVNAAFEKVTGYAAREAIGNKPSLLKSGQHDEAYYRHLWETILNGDTFSDVLTNRTRDGQIYYEEKVIGPLRNAAGEITGFISTGRDITQYVRLQERLQYLTHNDPLTGLPNRYLFTERLAHALTRARRSERRLAILRLDLNRFKLINDSLGHEVGDEILKMIAVRLRACLRDGDTVSRMESDEYAILLEDLGSPDDVPQVVRKVLDTVCVPLVLNERDLFVTTSMGISLAPDDGMDAGVLMRNADIAMHKAKELGKNNYRFYSAEMATKAAERLGIEADLHRALDRDEFRLHYQPRVDLHSGAITGAEALLRWEHPRRGLVSPLEFIPALEDTGLIVPVGEWVARTACRTAQSWRAAGHQPLRIAVNLSSRQFAEQDIVKIIRDGMEENGIESDQLECEITESLLLRDLDKTTAVLNRISELGVALAIDDFGTGYSSLSYIHRLPIDIIKIDRSFVQDITHNAGHASIVSAILGMARGLNLRVIAEGIETEGQLGVLRRMRCDEMQGYLFSKPLTEEAFAQLLRSRRRLDIPALPTDGQPTLLIVDDEDNVRKALMRLLRQEGYRILEAPTAREAYELLAANDVQVVISDQRMPEINGTEFLNGVKNLYPGTVRIVLSGYTDLKTVTDAINKGWVYKFLTKPWDDAAVVDEVRKAFAHHERMRGEHDRSAR